MKEQLSKEAQETIFTNIKEYIIIFAKQSSGYLVNLVEIMKEINKKIFYEIIVIFIEELNNYGEKCFEERKKFYKYYLFIFLKKLILFLKNI